MGRDWALIPWEALALVVELQGLRRELFAGRGAGAEIECRIDILAFGMLIGLFLFTWCRHRGSSWEKYGLIV